MKETIKLSKQPNQFRIQETPDDFKITEIQLSEEEKIQIILENYYNQNTTPKNNYPFTITEKLSFIWEMLKNFAEKELQEMIQNTEDEERKNTFIIIKYYIENSEIKNAYELLINTIMKPKEHQVFKKTPSSINVTEQLLLKKLSILSKQKLK